MLGHGNGLALSSHLQAYNSRLGCCHQPLYFCLRLPVLEHRQRTAPRWEQLDISRGSPQLPSHSKVSVSMLRGLPLVMDSAVVIDYSNKIALERKRTLISLHKGGLSTTAPAIYCPGRAYATRLATRIPCTRKALSSILASFNSMFKDRGPSLFNAPNPRSRRHAMIRHSRKSTLCERAGVGWHSNPPG